MNQQLQTIFDIVQQNESLTADEKTALIKAVKKADSDLTISEFKLERTEKVKRTTGILLEETIEELEQKRKAVEAHNRELEVEGALERVRSRTMAMHNSEELAETAVLMFDQLKQLGAELFTCGFAICKEDDELVEKWMSSPISDQLFDPIFIPYTADHGEKTMYDTWKKKIEVHAYVQDGEELRTIYKHLMTIPSFRDNYGKVLESGSPFPTWQKNHVVSYKYGYLLIITTKPFEDTQVFVRFANVFNQTYTRFLDLQKAEAQAREAQIEAAMERIRSRAIAMRSSDELLEVALEIRIQTELLGQQELEASAVHLYEKDAVFFESMAAIRAPDDTGGITTHSVKFPVDATPKIEQMMKNYWAGLSQYTIELDQKQREEWEKILEKHLPELFSGRLQFENDAKATDKKEYWNFADFSGGSLLTVTYAPPTPDTNELFRKSADVFDLAYKRYKDLQKAEAQAREAQIESALERVRSRSLAMRQSEELLDVITEIFLQLEVLEITLDSCFINIYKDKNPKDITAYIAAGGRTYEDAVFVPFIKNPMFTKLLEARENNQNFYSLLMDKKHIVPWWKQFFSNAANIEIPRKRKNLIAKSPGIATSVSLGKYASIHVLRYVPTPYSDEENQVIMRFGKAFDQVYTRFLDLQKAEAQTREAQIETALERVRARSLAMRNSNELAEVAYILFEQLKQLGTVLRWCWFSIFDDDLKGINSWYTDVDGAFNPTPIHQNFRDFKDVKAVYVAWKAGEELYFNEIKGKALKTYVGELGENQEFKKGPTFLTFKKNLSGCLYQTHAIFKHGYVGYSSFAPRKKENLVYFPRFARVFEQVYTRFLDLQKAEAQTREAQIETALERVRSKAMAMRSSEDIGEATMILFKEIEKLDIVTMRCGILIIHQNKVMDVWTASTTKDDKIISVSGQIDMTIHPLLKNVYRSWKAKEAHTQYELLEKDGEKYYEALSKEIKYQLPSASIIKDRHYNTCFIFNEGALFAFTKEGIPENDITIFKRFAKVFGLTYQRYRELIESEKREKETKKQSSLDRVRGEIASMRSTEDLNRITPIIWQELTNLGVPFFRCGVFIMNEENKNIQVHLSDPKGKSLGLMNLDYTINDFTKNSVDAWRKNSVFKDHWSKEEFINWTKSLMDLGKIKTKKGYQGGDDAPESLDLHFVPFSQGMLYVGNLKPLTEDQIELVKNLSESFSIAYARYEDFVKLEKAKESIESTLTELQNTQTQLIQSEKMASLGELTAGIAHEIQNPLNFVNNFSEVSKELLEEMMEEMKKGDVEEVKAIMADVVQNLDKINHHGKRADGIVKGMLQHSRASGDKKEPTDLNKLADEYLRLAYHGLRAKDKSFNATLETDFDETIHTIDVIPQDIGRVILNMVTNAFYAVSEKIEIVAKDLSGFQNLTGLDLYEPTVSISTKKNKDTVEIKVTDNGNGIPDSIKKKVFQPFFTTKPTGQGTGLGLSLSYDIITKGHDGELKVETEEGKGTKFIITLPV